MKVAEHGPDFESLRALIDSLPALIHTGRPDGYLDFFNQRWLEFVGLRLEELEGWKWTAAVHPDDVAALVAMWRACLAMAHFYRAIWSAVWWIRGPWRVRCWRRQLRTVGPTRWSGCGRWR